MLLSPKTSLWKKALDPILFRLMRSLYLTNRGMLTEFLLGLVLLLCPLVPNNLTKEWS